MSTLNLQIDGQPIDVPHGTSVIEAASKLGIFSDSPSLSADQCPMIPTQAGTAHTTCLPLSIARQDRLTCSGAPVKTATASTLLF